MSTVALALLSVAWPLLPGCNGGEELPTGIVPTNETRYVGSSACGSCHAGVYATHIRTGHSQALKPVETEKPVYPADAAGVPTPPTGYGWPDISYVIDGYDKAALFVDLNGYLLTNGTAGTNTQYNLAHPAIGLPSPQFASFRPNQVQPLPFSYDLFERRTTGPETLTENGGMNQENRPGIEGTWAEAGVQCEACHGPGSKHVPNPTAGNINVDAGATVCARCHTGEDSQVIAASNNLIEGFQQATELAASPHAGFACNVCHDPHVSVKADPSIAIRNDCTACHPDMNLALHSGLVYKRGDYTEEVTCKSCHMPYAVKTFLSNTINLTNGLSVKLGDTRSHIFRLDPTADLAEMFSNNGTQVAENADGQAVLSTCLTCQRCHNGLGNAFAFPAESGCALGSGIHGSQ